PASRAAVALFPAGRQSVFDPLMQRLGYDPRDGALDFSPAGIGNLVADAILRARHRDGANQLGDEPGGLPGVPYSDYTGFVSPNAPLNPGDALDPAAVHDPNACQPLTYVDATGTPGTQRGVGTRRQRA